MPGGVGDLRTRRPRGLADACLPPVRPGHQRDLRWWTGWTVALTKQALADGGPVPEVEPEEGARLGRRRRRRRPTTTGRSWVALLPSLDPTTMGWKQRGGTSPACADAFDRNGNAGPTIWADGRVVGAWAQAPDGAIRSHWFGSVSDRTRRRRRRRRPSGCARCSARPGSRVRFLAAHLQKSTEPAEPARLG